LKQHVKSKLAPYKYPRWVEFASELPKTATGKIQDLIKRLLQDTVGVERLGEIKVLVYRIATTEEDSASQEEDESELEDTEIG